VMELAAQNAFENYRARWNRVFNVESDELYRPGVRVDLERSRSL